ncbi:MAG: glycosyl hydrolase [Bacteroidota bacterium]
MLGYPAGHGQDGNINDHHFHWGYFIHAAAFLEQFEPGWAAQWGDMINLLVRDAATADRDDAMFPFLRNFSPYAGHCWANGFASFPQGNDQESTSESMQFNSSLIHWGAITGNDSIRDLGIYLYTTEQTAIEEYWLDINDRVFQPNQQYSLISRLWGNSYDNGTFWTADIAASYGIQLYPIHGGALYLGHHVNYVNQLWNEIEMNTGILSNEVNPNLWHDVYWSYLAFADPDKALTLYNSYPDRELKFGVSDAQTYHWLHAMKVLGQVDITLTADDPLAAAFTQNGETIYVAHNYADMPRDVTFSDGYILTVPAESIATSKDISLKGELGASFDRAYPGGSVDLTATVTGGTATKVEFWEGETLLGDIIQAPYVFEATGVSVGINRFYAKVYEGDDFNVTNLVSVRVGEQLPFLGNPTAIPGTLEAGHFDIFREARDRASLIMM